MKIIFPYKLKISKLKEIVCLTIKWIIFQIDLLKMKFKRKYDKIRKIKKQKKLVVNWVIKNSNRTPLKKKS